MTLSPADLIDQTRYPVSELDSEAGRTLVSRVRADLAGGGAGCLRGFLAPDALARLAEEARSLIPLAYRGPAEATPYFFDYQSDAAATLPDDHPLRVTSPRRLSQVAYDLIPEGSRLRALYEWEDLAAFLARVLGVERLYRSADPYQALNISVMAAGGCQQWHFDNTEFAVTLLLQAPEVGGGFEFVPNIRSADDENYDAVGSIIRGARDGIRSVVLEAGTLMLFRGRFSLHRVTEVRGERVRLQSILGFNPIPGVTGKPETNIRHYGERCRPLKSVKSG